MWSVSSVLRERLYRKPWWTIGLITLAASILGLSLSLLNGPLSPSKVGTLGDWIVGWGAVLAACVALWTVGESRRDRELERTADISLQRRAEAESVFAEFDLTDSLVDVVLLNFGTRPIRRVRVVAYPVDHRGGELRAGSSYPLIIESPHLAPHGNLRLPAPSYVHSSDVDVTMSQIEYSFVDIQGIAWRRSTDGQLHEGV